MKRSPLPRTATLARGPLHLTRRAPLARAAMRREPASRPAGAPKGTEWPQEVRDVVAARSRGVCETCGRDSATDLHHRQARRTRAHTVPNALHLCRRCHSDAHSHPQDARDAGWIVSAYSRPESTPVVLARGRWVLLTDDGRYDDHGGAV